MKPIPVLCQKTVTELCALLDGGQITSVEIVQAYLRAIDARDGEVHAYLETYPDDALREAAESDRRRAQGRRLSPLDGVPIAVKDNLVMRGRVCSCASRMLESFRSPYDATVIQKLHAAGMPILGRLNMDEFAMGGSTENSAFGVTRNPWKLDCVPGGSSGGSAAAVAAGMAPAALGSDTGGSIRQPASFCGVVGVKPAYGMVSRYGLVAFASSLDQIGPLCKTAADAALVLDVICGGDPHDMTSDPTLAQPCTVREARDLSGLTVGLPRECFGEGLDQQVCAAVETAAEALHRLGMQVREVSIPSLPYALPAYYVISSAEASSNLARFDGVRYGRRAPDVKNLEELYVKSRSEGFGQEVKRRIMLGAYVLSSGYYDAYYRKAAQVRRLIRDEYLAALEQCDVLCAPVSPVTAWDLGSHAADPLQAYLMDAYTLSLNLAGLPGLSLPVGLGAESKMPVGLQLIGPACGETRLLGIGHALERALPGIGRPTL